MSCPPILVLPGALRSHRERKGWSQSGLAHYAGVTDGMIGMIESGRRQPSAELAERLAGVLGITVDAFAFLRDADDPCPGCDPAGYAAARRQRRASVAA